jgi:hypothetical protein
MNFLMLTIAGVVSAAAFLSLCVYIFLAVRGKSITLYSVGLIESVVRNCNGLNVMVLQLGVVLSSGNTRFDGTVRAIQEKFHQILPGLISPIH